MKYVTVAKLAIVICSTSMILFAGSLIVGSASSGEKFEENKRPWLLLSNLVGVTKLVDILQENTAPNTAIDEIAHSAVGIIEGDLLVVDFNSSALCGRGGCAIAVYRVSTGEQLLFTYATQPAGEPIVELTERSGVELPCLLIAPPINTPAQEIVRDTLCYRDGKWVMEGS